MKSVKFTLHQIINMETLESNGNFMEDEDYIYVNEHLNIKWIPNTSKWGNLIKNIRLSSDPKEVECKNGKSAIVLNTQFLKKV